MVLVAAGRMFIMPRAFPREFREDVVARRWGTTCAQIARDFGISETTVQNWASSTTDFAVDALSV
jgi:transposase-like protein